MRAFRDKGRLRPSLFPGAFSFRLLASAFLDSATAIPRYEIADKKKSGQG
jgi:hypothetical protein